MGGRPRLARQRLPGYGAVTFALQRAANRASSARRRMLAPPPGCRGGAPFCRGFRPSRRLAELYACPSRFRQTNGDGLFRRPGAVFAFADVVDLLADELACLCRRRLALPLIARCASHRLFLRHDIPPRQRPPRRSCWLCTALQRAAAPIASRAFAIVCLCGRATRSDRSRPIPTPIIALVATAKPKVGRFNSTVFMGTPLELNPFMWRAGIVQAAFASSRGSSASSRT
jgi:hypothetical protein